MIRNSIDIQTAPWSGNSVTAVRCGSTVSIYDGGIVNNYYNV